MRSLFIALVCSAFLTACSGITSFELEQELTVHTLYSSLSNVHLVEYDGVFFMIDAGVHGEEARFEHQIQALGHSPKDLSFIMLTHGHTDHSGTAKYFQDKYQIPVICGKGDEELLLKGQNDSLCATNLLGSAIKLFVPEKYPSLIPDIIVDGEYRLSKFGVDGRIVPMEGHTDGSIALVLEEAAFVGDIIRGKAMAKKTPELHFFQCDLEKNEKEIKKALTWNCDLWFTGHFGPLKPERVEKWLASHPYH